MYSGKEKTQLLLSVLQEKSDSILSKLSEESSNYLTTAIGNAPSLTPAAMNDFLLDTLKDLSAIRDKELAQNTQLSFGNLTSEIAEKKKEPLVEPEPTPEPEPQPQIDSNLETPEKISGKLSALKPQIVAFFLHKCEPELRESISQYLPSELKKEAQSIKIDNIPIADTIYEEIYNDICIKKTEEETEPTNTQSEKEPATQSLFF